MEIRKALVIAPHADDETFGCGGTIAKLTNQGIKVDLILGTLGYDPESYTKRQKEMLNAMLILGVSDWSVLQLYKEGTMDTINQAAIVSALETNITIGRHDVVFIPYPSHHQDHIVMHQACMAALRPGAFQPQMILMYEYTYPTWVVPDQYNGRMFVDITETLTKKCSAIDAYESQLRGEHTPVSSRAVRIMASARGISAGVQFAEMFYVIQMKDIL